MKIWIVIAAFVALSHAQAAPPRLAIIADGDASSFGDALMAKLSEGDSCQLVERAELDRLGQEASVQKLSNPERPQALARLTKADLLMVVRLDGSAAKHPLLAIRLVGVSDGLVRGGFVLPWLPQEIAENAQRAAAQLLPMLHRFEKERDTVRVPVSLLGLRGTLDTAELRAFETTHNTLLAHRLIAQPGLVVSERWRLDDLVFEKALAPFSEAPVATGAVLVDGSFTANAKLVTLRLHARRSESDIGMTQEIQGDMERPVEFAEAVATALIGSLDVKATPAPWQPAKEAQAFAEQGQWMVRHWLAPQAAEAFESAVALGDHSDQTLTGRAKAYSMGAWPDDLRTSSYGGDGGYDQGTLKEENLPFHLASATRAVHYAADYVEAHPKPSTEIRWSLEKPSELGRCVFFSGLRTLRAAREAGLPPSCLRFVPPLREALQRFVKVMDASTARFNGSYNRYKVNYAAYWCDSAEDTMKFYRLVLAPDFGKAFQGQFYDDWDRVLRSMLTEHFNLHGPFFGRTDKTTRRNQLFNDSTERLIDWTRPDSDRVTAQWADFISELRSSPSARAQADGLAFEMQSHGDTSEKLRLLEQSTDLLWKHRAMLATHEGEVILASLPQSYERLLPVAGAADPPKSNRGFTQFVALLQDLFEKEAWVPRDWVRALRWIDRTTAQWLSQEQKQALANAFVAYETRAAGDPRWAKKEAWLNARYGDLFHELSGDALRAMKLNVSKPEASLPPLDPLVVSDFWNPWKQPPAGSPLNGSLGCRVMVADGGRLWVSSSGGGVAAFDVKSKETQWLGKPEGMKYSNFTEIAFNSDEVWAADAGTVWHRRIESGPWAKLELPEANYRLRRIGDDVYISFGNSSQTNRGLAAGAGIGCLSGVNVKWDVSTRRRPASAPLDNLQIRELIGVFAGPASKPWTAIEELKTRRICSVEDPEASSVGFKHRMELIPDGRRTLILESVAYAGECRKFE